MGKYHIYFIYSQDYAEIVETKAEPDVVEKFLWLENLYNDIPGGYCEGISDPMDNFKNVYGYKTILETDYSAGYDIVKLENQGHEKTFCYEDFSGADGMPLCLVLDILKNIKF